MSEIAEARVPSRRLKVVQAEIGNDGEETESHRHCGENGRDP